MSTDELTPTRPSSPIPEAPGEVEVDVRADDEDVVMPTDDEEATVPPQDSEALAHSPAAPPSTPKAVEEPKAAAESAEPEEEADDEATVQNMSVSGLIPAPTPSRPIAIPEDPYAGTTFGDRYLIEKLVGEGGMGFVYLARHKVIDKKVAVKVLRADLARDREILDRFVQEAKSASSIGHPHIIDISDFGDLPDGSTYFVMEYLNGISLTQAMSDATRFDSARVCHVGAQIADGLAAAHAHGIRHRDLKPDNVFLIERSNDKDFVKVLDFGIAKVSNSPGASKLTKAGAVFGTPHYMSPEQAAGSGLDHRTDIYSLGVMLYEMTSGQLPFNADNFMGILTQHMYKAPVPLRTLMPAIECPPGLEAIVLKCLSKKPEGRYASMKELKADLDRMRAGEVPEAVTDMIARSGGFAVPQDYFKPSPTITATASEPPAATGSKKPLVAAGIGAAILAVMGLGFALRTTGPSDTAQPSASGAASAVTVLAAPPSAAASSPPIAISRTTIRVAVSAVPPNATALRDGVKIALPSNFDVEEGTPVHIEVRADGYDPLPVDLDGVEKAKLVKLVRAKFGPKGLPVAPGKGTGGKRTEIVDPWK